MEMPHHLFNMINTCHNVWVPHGLSNMINMINLDLYMYDYIAYYQLYY